MRTSYFGLLVALIVGGFVPLATAQPMHTNEGRGIKLGSSLVGHLGIAVETALDSNVFYTDTNEAQAVESAPFLRLVPHLALSTLSSQRGGAGQKVSLRLGSSVGMRRYISDNENVTDNSAIDVTGDFKLVLNPEGAVALAIYDNLVRSAQTRSFESSEPYKRTTNQVGGKITLQPGGRALVTDLGYDFNLDRFDDAFDGGLDASANWHRFYGGIRWKFLPKSAVSVDAEGRAYQKADDTGTLSDSVHGRGYVGFETLWTPRFGSVLRAGLGTASYDEGDDATQFLVIASLDWYLGPRAKVSLGYERNLSDSIFSNTYVDDAVSLSYRQPIGDRLYLGLKPTYRHRVYAGLPDEFVCDAMSDSVCYEESERTDHIIEFESNLDFRVVEWFFIGAAYYVQVDATDFATLDMSAAGGGGREESNSFTKHVVMGRMEVTY